MRSSVTTVALATTTSVSLAAAATAVAQGSSGHEVRAAHTELLGRSILLTETYRPGTAPSGFLQSGVTAVPPSYPAQPVQCFSATHRNADGSCRGMTDNGFGTKENGPTPNRARPTLKIDRRLLDHRGG